MGVTRTIVPKEYTKSQSFQANELVKVECHTNVGSEMYMLSKSLNSQLNPRSKVTFLQWHSLPAQQHVRCVIVNSLDFAAMWFKDK